MISDNPKNWWSSKIVLMAIGNTVMGAVELVNQAINVMPGSTVQFDLGSILQLGIGIATVIARIWFTNQQTTKPLGLGNGSNGQG